MALTTEHIGAGLMAIGVVIFAGMLTIRLFSSSGDWPLLLPIVIIGVVISYVGFALVLADNSRRARSCECSWYRVRVIAAQYRPFIGLQGRVVERDLRMPFVRVELDRVPEGCSARTFWFANDRVERL